MDIYKIVARLLHGILCITAGWMFGYMIVRIIEAISI